MESQTSLDKSKEVKCTNCGAELKYKPGTKNLECEFCGAKNEITSENKTTEHLKELDFEKYLTEFLDKKDNVTTIQVLTCSGCSAQTQMGENVTADQCDFCGNPLTVEGGSNCEIIRPKGILPFAIDKKNAFEAFKKWINGLWWAPNNIKNAVKDTDSLSGMFIPYWTFDSQTNSDWTGRKGINRTETYTATENGKTVTRTRTVTDWYNVSGHLDHFFDDVLVLASNSLPKKYTEKLEPWDLENLEPYDDRYLKGLKSESYQVDLPTGNLESKEKMDIEIRRMIKREIGGDKQRIDYLNTVHTSITFKHILLPIWLSAFRYNDKPYRFMVNGRTGEVQGERPYSWIKITLAVLFALAVIGTAIWYFKVYKGM